MVKSSKYIRALYACAICLASINAVSVSQTVDPGTRGVHDPGIIISDGYYYVYSTGADNLPIGARRSRDLISWQQLPSPLEQIPQWVQDTVGPDIPYLWAPGIIHHNGRYYLNYSAAESLTTTRALIGLLSNETLDPDDPRYEWIDHGEIISSRNTNQYRTIDGVFIHDTQGQIWMIFGSHWQGIYVVRLDNQTLQADSGLHQVARYPQPGVWHQELEGAYLLYRHGYYYLFVNHGGFWSDTYRIVVGRSRNITGPYYDADGVNMLDGGGTLLLHLGNRWHGAGHFSAVHVDGQDFMAYHSYDSYFNMWPTLRINYLDWTDDHWPVAGQIVTEPYMPGVVPRLWGHWKLDGYHQSTAYNSTGAQTHGTYQNFTQTHTVAGPRGRAMSFDADQSHIELPRLDFAGKGTEMTVTLWARPEQVQNWARFIDFGNAAAQDNILFSRWGNSDDLTFQVFGGTSPGDYVTAAGALELGKWQFLAATIDAGGQVRLYKDGLSIAQGTTNPINPVARNANYIAKSNWSADDYFAGQMQDVRVYNYVLCPEQIKSLYRADRELKHHWKLDDQPDWQWDQDSSYTRLADSGQEPAESFLVTGPRQINRDMVLFDQPGATDQSDGSIGFKGALERAQLGSVAPQSREFTMTLWFNMDVLRRNPAHILSADQGQNGRWSVNLWKPDDAQKPLLRFQQHGLEDIVLIEQVNSNQWYHLMLTRNSSSDFNVYVDNQLVHAGKNPVKFVNAEQGLWLADSHDERSPLDGWIDDVRIYTYAVDDIADLTGDRRVGPADLAIFTQYWLHDSCHPCRGADRNLDGKVDMNDLAMLAKQWLAGAW